MSVFRRGLKRELFLGEDPVENEEQEQEAKLAELYNIWIQPKDGPAKEMSVGEWIPELGLVRVQQQRGNILYHMGFIWQSKLHLFVEEALYLMDRGSLILLREGCDSAISLQEGYSLMVASGCCMERYIVYTHLMRCGYYVKRHPAVWTLQDHPNKDLPALALASAAWQYPQLPGFGCEPKQADPDSEQAPLPAKGSGQDASESQHNQPRGESAEVPATVESHDSTGDLDISNSIGALYRSGKDGGRNGCSSMAPEPDSGSPQNTKWWAGLGSGHPWLKITEAEAASLLPPCQVLEEPQEERGGACISAVDTFPAIAFDCDVQPTDVSHVVFDVLRPNSKLKRKGPSEPFQRVCIARSPPTFSDARAALTAASPCPVLFALVEDGVVTLYDTKLPELANNQAHGNVRRGNKNKGKWRRDANNSKKGKRS